MNIVFFGSDKFVIPILEKLREEYKISLVLTTEKPPLASKGRALQGCPIIQYCTDNTIPYLAIQQFSNETIEQLKKINTEVAILAFFGLILPQAVLNLFPKGIINVHPSLLPKFRGPTPVQSAILAGEKETGVSIIRLDNQVDHGPILIQEPEPILDTDTSATLHEKLFTKGAELLVKVLPKYVAGDITPKPQEDAKATFTTRLTRESGFIDSSKLEIGNCRRSPNGEKLEIARMVRAYYPWPGVWTKIRIMNKEVRIKLLPARNATHSVAGGPNIMLQVEGKKPVSYKDFLNGYPAAKSVIVPIANTTNIK